MRAGIKYEIGSQGPVSFLLTKFKKAGAFFFSQKMLLLTRDKKLLTG
jgi:hypothetical protein